MRNIPIFFVENEDSRFRVREYRLREVYAFSKRNSSLVGDS